MTDYPRRAIVDIGSNSIRLVVFGGPPRAPAVLFNRGMARLFEGRIAEARPLLQKAIDALPETSGWHALARLYLAVADIHG